MADPKPIRIAVGAPTKSRSSIWRIWFGPSDIYTGFSVLGGVRKASVHFPRPGQPSTLRYAGYTKTFAERLVSAPVPRRDRTHLEWKGGELTKGHTVEFRFRIPNSELRTIPMNNSPNVHWIEAPGVGRAIEVTIVSAQTEDVGEYPRRADGTPTSCIAERKLPNGRTVWALSSTMAAPTSEEMEQYRFAVRRALAVHGHLPDVKAASEDARINLTFECPDGSAGELELAADFLRDVYA